MEDVQQDGRLWRYVGRLAGERETAQRGIAARQAMWRARMGLAPVPAQHDPARLWCGHPASAALRDEQGVDVCAECAGGAT